MQEGILLEGGIPGSKSMICYARNLYVLSSLWNAEAVREKKTSGIKRGLGSVTVLTVLKLQSFIAAACNAQKKCLDVKQQSVACSECQSLHSFA